MKILTWNLERLKKNKNELIVEKLKELDADILILTETSSEIFFGQDYTFVSTKSLPQNFDGIKYKQGENRTTIWTKYEITNSYKTYDDFTSVCGEIETPFGSLLVYGTIIGVFGGKDERFKNDLKGQLIDFEHFFVGAQVCVAGDFNVMFSGYAYPSHEARQILNDVFKRLELINITAEIPNNVDQIILSNHFKDKTVDTQIWNSDKTLSDHIGICLTIKE